MAQDDERYVATVTAVVEIEVGGVWGEKTTLAQVRKQAADSGSAVLSKLFSNDKDRSKVRRLGVAAIKVEPEK